MLLRFGVENLLSFRDYQEISLVVPKRANQEAIRGLLHPESIRDPVLPVAGIYGANASGKSNLLGCLALFLSAIQFSHSRPGMPGARTPFRLDALSRNAPSRMECDVIVDGVRYQYGFRIDDHRVLEEWLYAFAVGSRHRILFHRNLEEPEVFYFGPHMKGNNRVLQEQTREDSLFLSAAGINNHKLLTPLWKFFINKIAIDLEIDDRTFLSSDINELETNSVLQDQVVSFLREADTGISGLQIRALPNEHKSKIMEAIDLSYSVSPEQQKILKTGLPKIKNILYEHQIGSECYNLPHRLESRGTQTMLGIAIHVRQILDRGGVLIVDEIESGLHPFVAKRLVDVFQDGATNPLGAQLLFATHDTHLMTDLAPAQIWLCEKNPLGATEIYPLTAARPRKGENLENGYLKGRYGGVPYMGPIENLWSPTRGDARGDALP